MQEMEVPESTEELRSALRDQGQEVVSFLETLPMEEFFAPQATYWSPSEHLRHLVKCVRPLARALSYPKALLLLRYGPSLRPSRAFKEVRDHYRGKLAAGATAGAFSPSSKKYEDPPETRRKQVFEQWRVVVETLDKALDGWGELSLDRIRLPHPVMGKLTVREMLLWNLYHNHHHLERVRERQ